MSGFEAGAAAAAAAADGAAAAAGASDGGFDFSFDDAQLLRGEFDEAFLNEGVDEIDQDTTLTAPEKKRRREERLERNRQVARNCRKRKRERIEAMMDEVGKLREANRLLSLKLKMAQNKLGEATSGRGNRGKEDEEKRLGVVRGLQQMLDHKYSDEQILQRLQGYSETYSDFGEERNKLVKVHVSQLEQLLLPTQVSKMLLWLLKQDDDFYDDSNPRNIWNMLCAELNLNEQQKADLKDERKQLAAQKASMKQCLFALDEFDKKVERSMKLRRKQMEKVMHIITPTQTVKFLLWVENNQACVHMLNGLWSGNKHRQQQVMRDIMSVKAEEGAGAAVKPEDAAAPETAPAAAAAAASSSTSSSSSSTAATTAS